MMNSKISVSTFTNGKWKQNAYIVTSSSNMAVIIDPGSNGLEIASLIEKMKCTPLAVINTHAHYDHIGAIAYLQNKYSIPLYLHSRDEKLLKQANLYKIIFESKASIEIPIIDYKFTSETNLWIDKDLSFQIIETPGHTPGSICIVIDGVLFSGDTIFLNGPGRIDLPGGNAEQLRNTLNKLKLLDSHYIVYPGHGFPFNLGECWKKLDYGQ